MNSRMRSCTGLPCSTPPLPGNRASHRTARGKAASLAMSFTALEASVVRLVAGAEATVSIPEPVPETRHGGAVHAFERVVLALSAFLLPATAEAQEHADLILVDGVIHTMDPENPRAEALAAIGGEIVALGSSSEVLAAWRGPETVVIDAAGAPVLPGLIDAHAHMMNLGRFLLTVDLFGTRSAAEVAERVGDAVGAHAPGEWIVGRGWDQNDWEVKEFPTREILDRVAPANPVFLDRVDGHAVWVNTAALRSEEHTSELQSRLHLVCRLLLEKKNL